MMVTWTLTMTMMAAAMLILKGILRFLTVVFLTNQLKYVQIQILFP